MNAASAPAGTTFRHFSDRSTRAPSQGEATRIEIVAGKELNGLGRAWRDLSTRAAERNVFMNPELVRVAADAYPDTSPVAVLAWKSIGGHERLTGFWGFSVGHPNKSSLPMRVLKAPSFPHAYLSTPVIDRAYLNETLDEMLDGVAASPDLPKIIALDSVRTDGPVMTALANTCVARSCEPLILQRFNRPRLQSPLDGKTYLEQSISSSSRKKLRQQRRRLAERGVLTSVVHSDPDVIAVALEQFLRLEASGWKGRKGTALLCSPAEAAFFRHGFAALAAAGSASIHALYVGDKPVSMQLVVREGDTGFTWKTAYDESFQDFSPGMLLLEDYTTAFLRDESIAFVDSCASDDSSYMSAWSERLKVADLWIDARRGGSSAFLLMGKLETLYRDLRSAAKRQYHWLSSPGR